MKYWLLFALFFAFGKKIWSQAADSVYWAGVEDSLRNKAINFGKKSQFDEALVTAKQAVQVAKENFGMLNTQTAGAFSLLASIYRNLGNYDSSEVELEMALSIRKQISGEEHIETLSIIIELAAVYRLNSKRAQAESSLLYAKLLLEKSNQTKDPSYRRCLGNLAEVYQDKGDFELAEALYLEVAKIKETQFGKESASYGATLHDLGNVYLLSGRLEEALNAYKSALGIFLNKLGRDHPFTANAYGNIGRVLIAFGDYSKGEEMLLEAVAIRKKIYGTPSRYYTFSITELATLYIETGRTMEGISLLEEARKVLKDIEMSGSQEFGITVSNLASAYAKTGDLIKTELYVRESKDVIGKTLGKESVYYAMSLCQLAEVYRATQRYTDAEKLIEEALDIWAKKQNIENYQYGSAMNETANFFIETSRLGRAETLLKDARNRTEMVSGKNNLIYIGIIERLSQVLAKLGKDSEAQTLIVEANDRERNLLKRETNAFTEKDLKNFMEEVDNSSNILFEFLLRKAYNKPTIAGSAFDNLLFYKGYLLQGVREMQWAMAFADDSTHQIYNRWKGYHRQLSQQYALPIADRQNTAMIEEKANALEKVLVSKVDVFGKARQQVNWTEVLVQLKPDEAAIEFAKFQVSDRIDSVYYCALVLRFGDSAPQFIPLFEKNELKELMRGASSGSNFLKINKLYTQKALYDLIWKPMEPLLTGINTIYCSPSGLLHRLNLAAIPTPEGKVYGERRQLVVLGSTRQLAVGSSSSSQAVAQDAYLAGGIRYDTDSTLVAYADRGATSRSTDSDALPFQPDSLSITRGGVLEYLPATAAEVGELSQTLRSAGYQTRTDTGFYATEESFRQLGVGKPSPRVVHLATHGYFFPDPAVSKKQLAIGNEPVFKISDHPMIRSGLILAGAKQAWLTGKHPEGQEDGILTAYEISQMNLSNTELVVLSACETGLGDIVGNEGVYGLQRAFKIAGAKYLIMSLWKVDDQSTRAFMSAFYRHWLSDKQSVPQAFRATQQEMRAKYAGAYDWAGFVLIE